MMKNLIGMGFAAIIAIASFFTGAASNFSEAFAIAMNKDTAILYCEKLVNGDIEETE